MDISLPILIQPTNSPAVPAVGQNPNTASATNLQPMLQDISLGTMLKGNVTQPRNAQGHVVISTDKGDLALKTDIPMKRGIEVVIKLEKATDELMAKIITIDSKSVAKYVESVTGNAQENEDTITRSNLLQESATANAGKTEGNKAAVMSQTVMKAVLVALPAPPATTNTAQALTDNTGQTAATAAPRIVTQQGTMPLVSGAKLNVTIASIQLPTQAPQPADTANSPEQAAPQAPKPQPQPMLRSAFNSGIAAYRSVMGSPPAAPQQPPALQTPVVAAPPPLVSATPSPETSQPATTNTSLPQPAASSPPLPATAAPTVQDVATPPPPAPATMQSMVTASAPHTQEAAPPSAPPTPSPAPTLTTTQPLPPAAASVATPAPMMPTPAASIPVPAASSATSIPMATPPSTTSSPKDMIHATVIQSEADGSMTLHSDVGTLRLFAPNPLPTGSTISLNVQQVDTSQPAINSSQSAQNTPLNALETLLKSIATPTSPTSPTLTMSTPSDTPSPALRVGKEMLGDIASLISAVKSGDLKKWLGDKTMKELGASGKTELLARLSGDFQVLRQAHSEPKEAGGWQHYLLPVNVDGQGHIEPIHLYHRHQQNEQEPEKKGGKPRMESTDHFIVGVEMSHFGTVQLDGFIKKQTSSANSKRTAFELLIRTHAPLPNAVQQEIRTIFINAQEVTGFTGNLGFRSGNGACLELSETNAALAFSANNSQTLTV